MCRGGRGIILATLDGNLPGKTETKNDECDGGCAALQSSSRPYRCPHGSFTWRECTQSVFHSLLYAHIHKKHTNTRTEQGGKGGGTGGLCHVARSCGQSEVSAHCDPVQDGFIRRLRL